MEMGYNFTSSVEACRSALASLGGRDLSASAVARILSMMARTHTGLDDQVIRLLFAHFAIYFC